MWKQMSEAVIVSCRKHFMNCDSAFVLLLILTSVVFAMFIQIVFFGEFNYAVILVLLYFAGSDYSGLSTFFMNRGESHPLHQLPWLFLNKFQSIHT
jgi:hypothetical protein